LEVDVSSLLDSNISQSAQYRGVSASLLVSWVRVETKKSCKKKFYNACSTFHLIRTEYLFNIIEHWVGRLLRVHNGTSWGMSMAVPCATKQSKQWPVRIILL